jgi:hypothetical protein
MKKLKKKRWQQIRVPVGWWGRLVAFCNKRWKHDHDTPLEIYEFTGISRRTFSNAKRSRRFTEATFATLVQSVGCETPDELLQVLSPSGGMARLPMRSSSPPSVIKNPKTFVLATKKEMPQWADSRELNLGGGRLEVVKCKIETESPYFRFGFKLLAGNDRVFGDGSIKSQDANLVVHIGRNNWNRPNLGISAKDIFFTWYLNGVSLESDRKIVSAGRCLSTSVELRISSSYVVTFSISGICLLNRVIHPGICRRVAVLAWGDREEYVVKVSDLSVNPASG